MKNAFGFALIALAACSGNSDPTPDSSSSGGAAPGTNGGGNGAQVDRPGQDDNVPVLDAPPQVGDDFETPPAFPDVSGSGFGTTAFPSASCDADCTDFPAEPIIVGGGGVAIETQELTAFADPANFAAGNLCVTEPQLSSDGVPGAMFPANWLRPRFRWAGGGNGALYEIRLSNEIEVSDLVVYTRQTEWVMPDQLWKDIARNVHTPISVTIRAASGGTITGTQGNFQIAPVNAGGSLVFWATTTALVRQQPQLRSRLFGFQVGEEAVRATLDPTQVVTDTLMSEGGVEPRGVYAEEQANVTGYADGAVNCVGCHISTPDGENVVFTDNWPWNKLISSIRETTLGEQPAFLSDSGRLMISQPWLGTQTMSPAFFGNASGRMLVSSYGVAVGGDDARIPWDNEFYDLPGNAVAQPQRHQLAWFDLSANIPLATWTEALTFSADPNAVANNPDPNANNNNNDDLIFPTTIAQLTPSAAQLAEGGRPPRVGQAAQELSRGELNFFRQATVANAEGSGWGLLTTTGETGSAVSPDWSHNGQSIAYVSTDVTSSDGHPDWTADTADIKIVPYGDRAGGTAVPLQGAASPNFLEYYPAFSGDDQFIAFTRAPVPTVTGRSGCGPVTVNGTLAPDPACTAEARSNELGQDPDGPYYNRNGEIFIVPSTGGSPVRLTANDPVSCSGDTSRGSINSWPKWSPRQAEVDGLTYYFLVFSSARDYEGRFDLARANYTPPVLTSSSQLYMATVVVDSEGAITTYPAVYLWNQNTILNNNGGTNVVSSSNLTPAWDEFLLPPIVIQ